MEENSIGGEKVGLDRAEELIAEGKLEEAQAVLDGVNEKDGEWHFVQAKLYIEKSWINEARKQLEIAVQCEPENAKYQEAYDGLKHRAAGEKKKRTKKNGSDCGEELCSSCAECFCEGCVGGLCGGA